MDAAMGDACIGPPNTAELSHALRQVLRASMHLVRRPSVFGSACTPGCSMQPASREGHPSIKISGGWRCVGNGHSFDCHGRIHTSCCSSMAVFVGRCNASQPPIKWVCGACVVRTAMVACRAHEYMVAADVRRCHEQLAYLHTLRNPKHRSLVPAARAAKEVAAHLGRCSADSCGSRAPSLARSSSG